MQQSNQILGTEINKQNYLEALARVQASRENPQPEIQTTQTTEDFWRVEGVEYRNEIYTVDLSKSILFDGKSKTQDQWAEYSMQAKQSGDFYIGDFPLYHALFTTLFNQENTTQAQEARKFLKKQFEEKWLATLTRIRYTSSGKDEVIHNFGLDDKYSIKETMIGPDEWIKNSQNTNYLEALLGTSDNEKINKVYKWIIGNDAYIGRINSTPKNVVDRVVGFGADPGGADLYCGWYSSISSGSLGVRAKRHTPDLY